MFVDISVIVCYNIGKLSNAYESRFGGTKMERSIFSERLASILKQQGITQKELARMIGVTEATMSRYIHGERIPRSEIIANIATALHTTSDYLLGTEDKGTLDLDYPKIIRLIARNSSTMSNSQKKAIIQALLEDD